MNCERKQEQSVIDYYFKTKQYYPIIFSHDFAKAFWGEMLINESANVSDDTIYDWEAHLQQMALEEEPLKYLEKFI